MSICIDLDVTLDYILISGFFIKNSCLSGCVHFSAIFQYGEEAAKTDLSTLPLCNKTLLKLILPKLIMIIDNLSL